jgi:hypothetical protein
MQRQLANEEQISAASLAEHAGCAWIWPRPGQVLEDRGAGTRMLTGEGGKPAEEKACGSPGRHVDARRPRIDLETTEQANARHHRQSVRARASLLRW